MSYLLKRLRSYLSNLMAVMKTATMLLLLPTFFRFKKENHEDATLRKSYKADKLLQKMYIFSLRRFLTICQPRKKLLILDINGLLLDIVSPPPKNQKADKVIARRAVFKRPFCLEFLKFCFEKFEVAVWSSRSKKILEKVIHFLLGDLKRKMLFIWDASHCTTTKFGTLENKYKPLVFKELRKCWKQGELGKKGIYNESNTLLLDDSPYKALLNPPYTSIFPFSYKYGDENDNSLGVGGDVRVYLEELAEAENIQKFVKQNPFGQEAIHEGHESWDFYNQFIIDTSSNNVVP